METRLERRVPLPWEHAKSFDEDAQAGERVDALVRASSYVQADRDTAFLRKDVTRGVRLQLDYLKTEEILRASGIIGWSRWGIAWCTAAGTMPARCASTPTSRRRCAP